MNKTFFDINNIFLTLWDYPMSHLEFWGFVTGLLAVYLSAQEKVSSWYIGLVNVSLSFFLYFQVQLYPDMFLQVFFFVTNLIGWWQWTHPKPYEANALEQLKITSLGLRNWVLVLVIGSAGTVLMGFFAQNLHTILPRIFSKPSAFPYMDSFVTVMSIMATFTLIRKKIESWYLWLLIDLIATYMYFLKGIKVYSLEYAIFCVIALIGAVQWTKEYQKANSQSQ
jgi:nicotinamide mononucleotide transporter